MKRNVIYLLPIGEVSNNVLDTIASCIEKIYRFPVSIMHAVKIPKNAYHPERKQFLSSVLLKEIELMLPDDAIRVLAITDDDIFADDLNFVFGEAVIGGWVGIISLFRLYPETHNKPHDEDLFMERVVKEAVHELGHTFGLRHCPNLRCIMHFSNTIYDTDYKSLHFCSETSKLLAAKLESLRGSGGK